MKQEEFTQSVRVGDPGKPEWKPRLPWILTPEKFLTHFPTGMTPRGKQIEALTEINEHFKKGKRVVVLEMPTGGGKSILCMTAARAVKSMNGNVHFLTSNKQLQSQYANDFPAPEIEVMKGRSNYSCTHKDADQGAHCGDAPCTKLKKGILRDCTTAEDDVNGSALQRAVGLAIRPDEHLCGYWRQLQLCNDGPIALFNFSSFLFQQRVGRFGKRDLMIVDEAHNTEPQLMSYVSMELTEWALSIINVRIDGSITSKDQFVEWLRKNEISQKIDSAMKKSDSADESDPEDLSKAEADALRDLQGKIGNFLRFLDKTEWILETIEYKDRRGDAARKIVARPLYAKAFASDLLFSKADRFLMMSATILDVKIWAENLGLSMDEVGLVQTACDFPVENRPVFLTYAGNCSYKTIEQTKPKLVTAVINILKKHEGQRGIIHSHSFDLSNLMRDQVASDRFLFQAYFKNDKDAMLAEHARRSDSVIVAPAMAEGLDLKDDLGRFQVLLKVPYPSMADKVIKERMDRDPRYFAWLTSLKFCQSLGRIVRSKTDFGYTYVLDSGFEGFLSRNGSMIPGWIKESFKRYHPKEVRRA